MNTHTYKRDAMRCDAMQSITSLQVLLVEDIDHLPEQSLVYPLEVDPIEGSDGFMDPSDQLLLILV
jgi:hypothetical protein